MPKTAGSPTKRRWITIIFFFLSGIITATWASRIPDVQKELALNNAQWGLVLFALPAGLVSGLPLSSWLVAKFSAQRIITFTMTIYILMLFSLGLSISTFQVVVSLYLFGLSRNATNISLNTYALEIQTHYQKPIVATFHGVWSAACFVAVGVGTIMIAEHVEPFLHFLSVCVFCVVVTFLFRSISHGTPETVKERRPFIIFPDRYLFILGLICFCSMIVEGTMFDWSVNYFDKVVKVKREFITAGYTAFIITMAGGRLLGDRLIERFGSMFMLVSNGILMAAGFALAISFPYLLPACIGFFLVGLGDSILVPMLYTLAARTDKMEKGYAIVSVTLIGYVGFLAGPLIVGLISERIGMQWAFGLMMILSLCIVGLTFSLGYHQNTKAVTQA